MDNKSSEQKHWRIGMARMQPPGSDDFKGEPHWDEYYKKFDNKLVDLFKQMYDERKLAYYHIKCSKSLEEGLTEYKKYSKSESIWDKITNYAPTSESMPRELLWGVLNRGPHIGGHIPIRQLIRISKEQREARRKERLEKWIIEVTSKVTNADFLELERLERANQKRCER